MRETICYLSLALFRKESSVRIFNMMHLLELGGAGLCICFNVCACYLLPDAVKVTKKNNNLH